MEWKRQLLERGLDMAWISARSISPHADPVRQAAFKKNLSSYLQRDMEQIQSDP